ncbi:MAG: hypothetical protein AAB573_02155 [Patescibacteria group bacterium]
MATTETLRRGAEVILDDVRARVARGLEKILLKFMGKMDTRLTTLVAEGRYDEALSYIQEKVATMMQSSRERLYLECAEILAKEGQFTAAMHFASRVQKDTKTRDGRGREYVRDGIRAAVQSIENVHDIRKPGGQEAVQKPFAVLLKEILAVAEPLRQTLLKQFAGELGSMYGYHSTLAALLETAIDNITQGADEHYARLASRASQRNALQASWREVRRISDKIQDNEFHDATLAGIALDNDHIQSPEFVHDAARAMRSTNARKKLYTEAAVKGIVRFDSELTTTSRSLEYAQSLNAYSEERDHALTQVALALIKAYKCPNNLFEVLKDITHNNENKAKAFALVSEALYAQLVVAAKDAKNAYFDKKAARARYDALYNKVRAAVQTMSTHFDSGRQTAEGKRVKQVFRKLPAKSELVR